MAPHTHSSIGMRVCLAGVVDETEHGRLRAPAPVIWLSAGFLRKHAISVGEVVEVLAIATSSRLLRIILIMMMMMMMMSSPIKQSPFSNLTVVCFFHSTLKSHYYPS